MSRMVASVSSSRMVLVISFLTGIYLKDRSRKPLQVILREILLQNQEPAAGDGTGLYEKMMAAETMKYAIILVASVPVICLYPFVQKHFVKGVMVGAIKG